MSFNLINVVPLNISFSYTSIHNQFRSQIQNFTDTKSRQYPASSNMQKLHWDDELAESAQNLTDLCVFEHSWNQPSGAAEFAKYSYGENLFKTSILYDTLPPGDDVIGAWWNEHSFYDSSEFVCDGGFLCGHFLQAIYGETNRVGCAFSKCSDGTIVACQYYPRIILFSDRLPYDIFDGRSGLGDCDGRASNGLCDSGLDRCAEDRTCFEGGTEACESDEENQKFECSCTPEFNGKHCKDINCEIQ